MPETLYMMKNELDFLLARLMFFSFKKKKRTLIRKHIRSTAVTWGKAVIIHSYQAPFNPKASAKDHQVFKIICDAPERRRGTESSMQS